MNGNDEVTDARVSEFDDAYEDQRAIKGAIFGEPLGKVPRREALVVSWDTKIAAAIDMMNERHVGCALIVRQGKLAGIFTERDVLWKAVGKNLDVNSVAVVEVMTPDPDTLPISASIAYALRKMSVEGYRHIPIVSKDGSPIGVVGQRDIVAWMVDMFPQSVLNLPPEPGFPKAVDGG